MIFDCFCLNLLYYCYIIFIYFSVKWSENWLFSTQEKKPLLPMPSSQVHWLLLHFCSHFTVPYPWIYSTFGFRMSNVKQLHRKIQNTFSVKWKKIDFSHLEKRNPYSQCQAPNFYGLYITVLLPVHCSISLNIIILHLDFVCPM